MTKKWTKNKEQILSLYKDQNKPLHEVRQIMKNSGFDASVRAYRSRFDKWRVNKYNCQRRRNSSATQATIASFELPSPGISIGNGSPVYGSGAGPQLPPLARYFSSPDLGMSGVSGEAGGFSNSDTPKVETISPTNLKSEMTHYEYDYYSLSPNINDLYRSINHESNDESIRMLHAVLSRGDVHSDTYSYSPGQSQTQAILDLIEITSLSGLLDDRNLQGMTALQLYIRHFISPLLDNNDFWRVLAAFAKAGADTRNVIPHGFARDLCDLVRSSKQQPWPQFLANSLHQRCENMTTDCPLWVVIWLSACQQTSEDAVHDHLAVLESLIGGGGGRVAGLSELLVGSNVVG